MEELVKQLTRIADALELLVELKGMEGANDSELTVKAPPDFSMLDMLDRKMMDQLVARQAGG